MECDALQIPSWRTGEKFYALHSGVIAVYSCCRVKNHGQVIVKSQLRRLNVENRKAVGFTVDARRIGIEALGNSEYFFHGRSANSSGFRQDVPQITIVIRPFFQFFFVRLTPSRDNLHAAPLQVIGFRLAQSGTPQILIEVVHAVKQRFLPYSGGVVRKESLLNKMMNFS